MPLDKMIEDAVLHFGMASMWINESRRDPVMDHQSENADIIYKLIISKSIVFHPDISTNFSKTYPEEETYAKTV